MAKTEKTESKPTSKSHPEMRGLLLLSFFIIVIISLISFDIENARGNWLGLMGHGVALVLSFFFGIGSFLITGYLGYLGWKMLRGISFKELKYKHFAFALFLISTSMLLNLFAELSHTVPLFLQKKVISQTLYLDLPYPHIHKRVNLGGVPFYYLYRDLPRVNLQTLLSDFGTSITFSITALVSFLLLAHIEVLPFYESLLAKWPLVKKKIHELFLKKEAAYPSETALGKNLDEVEALLTRSVPTPLYNKKEKKIPIEVEDTALEHIEPNIKITQTPTLSKREKAIQAQKLVNGDFGSYQLPPASLLKNPKKVDTPTLKKDLKKQAEILEDTLRSFGIEAKVGDIHCGPTITSFEVHPAVGVKVQKIKALESDIALNLEAKSIRIIAPIPGKAAVGVEIPSLYPQEVSFKELLVTYQTHKKMHIPVLLGKTVSGENVACDLTKMPHCIIAGATGSGKSVCINTLIMSILMNARPDEIKLLLIDPKKVELTSYTKLPHLIAPVITEAHGAYAALNWLVKEMQQRYDLLKQLGLRNIHAFNARVPNNELEASLSTPVPEKMFAIVAIIDEFADLIMASTSDLETPIARIAQMARAVGIHLVLATQRPSREVITGLIKANFPTRISFKVASRINSQIILDDVGAESLLGNGDMLFLPPGSSQLIRAQGAYISDEEINNVITFIEKQVEAQYLISSFDAMKKEEVFGSDGASDEAKDSLYEEALKIVVETQNASTTFLQRKLKIGYARAASLMDELEERGVIGPQEGSKPRRILQSSSAKRDDPLLDLGDIP